MVLTFEQPLQLLRVGALRLCSKHRDFFMFAIKLIYQDENVPTRIKISCQPWTGDLK